MNKNTMLIIGAGVGLAAFFLLRRKEGEGAKGQGFAPRTLEGPAMETAKSMRVTAPAAPTFNASQAAATADVKANADLPSRPAALPMGVMTMATGLRIATIPKFRIAGPTGTDGPRPDPTIPELDSGRESAPRPGSGVGFVP